MPEALLSSLETARADFPLLLNEPQGRRQAYLDNASTTQKPESVIRATDRYYRSRNANVHRGVYQLSQDATREFEEGRKAIAKLVHAQSPNELIFTSGCTAAINLVAASLSSDLGPTSTRHSGTSWLSAGDVILLSQMEHHSNIVPWQIAAARVGATVRQIPITDQGEIDLDAYEALLKAGKVRLVGLVHVSNSLGTVNPVRHMVARAHECGALALVDGAQACGHIAVDVMDLDADFYTFSGHKMFGPTGIGVLYARQSLLEQMPPSQGGGDMIHTVDIENGTSFAAMPAKFEPGTPNIAGVAGLVEAVRYLESLGTQKLDALGSALDQISHREKRLAESATDRLRQIEGVRIVGEAAHKAGIVSFTMAAAHAHDVGTVLDHQGVCVRAGHHCCMPVMKRFGVSATTRASFAFYNDESDVDQLIDGVMMVNEIFER